MSTLILQQKRGSFSLAQKIASAACVVQLWMDRHHQRKQLAKLDSRQLADMGLNPMQVSQEIKKPFWK